MRTSALTDECVWANLLACKTVVTLRSVHILVGVCSGICEDSFPEVDVCFFLIYDDNVLTLCMPHTRSAFDTCIKTATAVEIGVSVSRWHNI
jgi:hypothetical protein